MNYQDNKYYLEVTTLTPRREGIELTLFLPFKQWDKTYTDWKREPWQNDLVVSNSVLYGNPSEFICVYNYDVTHIVTRYLLAKSKRWWNKVIKTVDTEDVYHIKCKLPRLSKHSDLRDCEVTAIISKTVLPEDLLPSNV